MCDYPNCANKGTFEGEQCPGSDDENEHHHCVDCGQLWWENKGWYCFKCEDYWCPDWQHTFKSPDDLKSDLNWKTLTKSQKNKVKDISRNKRNFSFLDEDVDALICEKCYKTIQNLN